jgi:hypothetical protein
MNRIILQAARVWNQFCAERQMPSPPPASLIASQVEEGVVLLRDYSGVPICRLAFEERGNLTVFSPI